MSRCWQNPYSEHLHRSSLCAGRAERKGENGDWVPAFGPALPCPSGHYSGDAGASCPCDAVSHLSVSSLPSVCGMLGNFVGRIKGAKYRFDLQFLTWDFS